MRVRPTPNHQRPMLISDCGANWTTGQLVCLDLQSENLQMAHLLPWDVSRQYLRWKFSRRRYTRGVVTSNIMQPNEYMSPDGWGFQPVTENRSGAAHLAAPTLHVLDNRCKYDSPGCSLPMVHERPKSLIRGRWSSSMSTLPCQMISTCQGQSRKY